MSFLTKEEERIIGSLIEKEFTTPEYYPLTLNALKNACNQKSNRYPVMNYSEKEVEEILESLFQKKMVFRVTGSDHRVPKYNENFTKFFELTQKEIAVMCILMLRGPQTVGEIRGRTGRIYVFENLGEVEDILHSMIIREGEIKFVKKLPRYAGRESRYVSILSGEPEVNETVLEENPEQTRIDQLEKQISELTIEVENLRKEFEKFREQFE